jgi:hypothetical protein
VNRKYNEEETIMTVRRKATALAVVVVLVLSVIVAVQTVLACEAGCTPGFWKQPQHVEFWTAPYHPDYPLNLVFNLTGYDELAGDTLLQALKYNGGPDLLGGARILLRAGVASLLNAAYDAEHGDPWLYWPVADIIAQVNAALADGPASGVSGTLIYWGGEFDDMNNMGCPLLED